MPSWTGTESNFNSNIFPQANHTLKNKIINQWNQNNILDTYVLQSAQLNCICCLRRLTCLFFSIYRFIYNERDCVKSFTNWDTLIAITSNVLKIFLKIFSIHCLFHTWQQLAKIWQWNEHWSQSLQFHDVVKVQIYNIRKVWQGLTLKLRAMFFWGS